MMMTPKEKAIKHRKDNYDSATCVWMINMVNECVDIAILEQKKWSEDKENKLWSILARLVENKIGIEEAVEKIKVLE